MTVHEKRLLIEPNNNTISITRQAQLLGISRSSVYYNPYVSERDVGLMNIIDQIYTSYPFYGTRRIKHELKTEYDHKVGREHIRTLMNTMGLETLYPKRKINTSTSDIKHKKYPYLLNNLMIRKPNQVWSTDITYIRLHHGFAYLVALIDWFSRYVLAWNVSLSLEKKFCEDTLITALNNYQKPIIHNSDQGTQFTSIDYTNILHKHNIQISMDGRGRCLDNIFVERLWRTTKQENIYLRDYSNIQELTQGINEYYEYYNNTRPHQSLDYHTPAQIYFKEHTASPISISRSN